MQFGVALAVDSLCPEPCEKSDCVLRLSKSRYIAGRQCPLQLWYRVFDPPPEPAEPLLLEGAEPQARHLFPGGVLAGADGDPIPLRIERTQALINDPACPAIFEATVAAGELLATVDILRRVAGGWDLIEVKSATTFDPTKNSLKAKPYIKYDAAFQREVLRRAGLPPRKVWIYHLNGEYELAGKLDYQALFLKRDITEECKKLAESVIADVENLTALRPDDRPDAEPGARCNSPFECEFKSRCRVKKPKYWTYSHLHNLNAAHFRALRAESAESVLDLDERNTAALPPRARAKHLRFRDVYRSGRPYLSPHLQSELSALGPPTAYLDFETIAPEIPAYEGTRPHSQIPFQYSLHHWDGRELAHREFLAGGEGDPRRCLARQLVADLARFADCPVVAYASNFEAARLNDLAALVTAEDPALARELGEIRYRLKDLAPIIRDNIVAAGFGGSYSMKSIAPAILGPAADYAGLQIADGRSAASTFGRIIEGQYSGRELHRQRHALLTYCRHDTLHLHQIHQKLGETAELVRALTDPPAMCDRRRNDSQ